MMPAAWIGAVTLWPDPCQSTGHCGTSSIARVRRSDRDAPPPTVQGRPAESVKLAAPAVCTLNTGLATTVPSMPLRTSAA
jgi:hypothetical protein